MCGRFTLRAPASVVAEQFALLEVPAFAPRFNIAPSQPVAVVRLAPDGVSPRRELVWLRWGLIPSWGKPAKKPEGGPALPRDWINARAETAAEKPAFRAAFRRRRCLVLADGFYEWRKTGRQKQPYFLRLRDDRPFAFAGLWEAWEGAEHSYIESCTILTTDANERVAPIHNRMPVILAREDHDRWLDPSEQRGGALAALLRPFPSDAMEAYPVSRAVNNPKHDAPDCIEPQRELF